MYQLQSSSWINDISSVLLADDLPQDVSGAEAILANHVEHKAEIDSHQTFFNAFKSQGEELIEANHYASNEVIY